MDREHYPLIIAVRLNHYQYGYKAAQIMSVMRLKPVTTSLQGMFVSHYTIKVVARSCRFLCLDSFSASVQIVKQYTLLYTVSLVFSHKSIVVSFILICTSLLTNQAYLDRNLEGTLFI